MMTEQADKKAEKIMSAYFDYIGEMHLENICRGLDEQKEEIDRIQVPESLDAWFIRFMDQHRKKESRGRLFTGLRKASSKAAVILLVLFVSMMVITVSVDAFRIKVYNLLFESNEKYSSVRVDELGDEMNWEDFYFPAYVPKGFQVKSARELKQVRIIEFTDDKGEYITFFQSTNGNDMQMDTEAGDQREVMVNDRVAILSEKSGKSILFWHNDECSFWLTSGLDGEVLVRIAESVITK